MKAYWDEVEEDGMRKMVVEMESEEEHKKFHEKGWQQTSTYHIHGGEEGLEFGGMGILLRWKEGEEEEVGEAKTPKEKFREAYERLGERAEEVRPRLRE